MMSTMARPGLAVALLLTLAVNGGELLPSLPHSPDLYVSAFFRSSIQRYYGPRSATSGPRPLAAGGGADYASGAVRRPWGIALGPDGDLYVANASGIPPGIVRIGGPSKASAGTVQPFVNDGLFYDLAIGPDGNLYAAGRGAVRRYDLMTGALIDAFTSGHDLAETRGLAFGPDGKLYVSSYDSCVAGPSGCSGSSGEIARFDAYSGAFVDVFVPAGAGGLQWPWKIAFGPYGDLFVVNWTAAGNNILRFALPAGSGTGRPFLLRGHPPSAVFISRPGWAPLYIAAGPDGDLYVSDSDSADSGAILRFDGRTGDFVDTFVQHVDGGPRGLLFASGPR
jgi:DNA-binding beta-propeller fold protein YncE